jgi:DNA topoisomerase-1
MVNLLLIESPGKLKKLGQILGPGWIVKASMGHIRELANDGEDALGFDLEGTQIHCRYEPRDARAKKVLAELRQAVKQASAVYIATDPDREGETIGWHLQQELRLKNPRRVVYSEITPAAVQQAIAHPRTLDQSLIAAGRARDCLDKLVGYKGSRHIVWQLNNGAKSMGRVQSATLHLLCVRERQIQTFKPEDYWSVWVSYREGFKAFYRSKSNPTRRAATAPQTSESLSKSLDRSSDDASSDKDSKPEQESDRVKTQAEADRLVAIARSTPHQVIKVEGKVVYQAPPPPFITSTLQQAAGAKLRFSPEKTMKVAQSLYEAGHITYMRTDSVVLSVPFCQAVRQYLEQHDPTNVPQRAAKHRAVKGSQEAHEAIRPTDVNRTPPLAASADEAKLYELIWQRAIASQCCAARLQKTRVITQSGIAFWEARGQVLEFAGYTRYWNNLSADAQLPPLQPGQALQLQTAQADQKQTQPPPRYTEPKLVQLMERQGIGRPSTYAPIIKTLRERDYVELSQGKLQPTALGLDLDAALEKLLPDLIQPAFTAQMEAALDAIASGQQDWQIYLTSWHRDYFAPAIIKARQAIGTSHFKETRLKETHLKEISPASPGQNLSPQAQKSSTKTFKNQASQLSKVICPSCGELMHKIPSHSKKLKANHFLKCMKPGCATVLFWNSKAKKYELPYRQRTPDPESFTDYPCPVCGALLERYSYTKEGQAKVMLRCSLSENRKGKCKEVAFFQAREGFWSPKYGVLDAQNIL